MQTTLSGYTFGEISAFLATLINSEFSLPLTLPNIVAAAVYSGGSPTF